MGNHREELYRCHGAYVYFRPVTPPSATVDSVQSVVGLAASRPNVVALAAIVGALSPKKWLLTKKKYRQANFFICFRWQRTDLRKKG